MSDTLVKVVKLAKNSLDVCVENYLTLAKMFYEYVAKIQEVCREEGVKSVLKKHGLCN